MDDSNALLSPTDYENLYFSQEELPPRNYAHQAIRAGGTSIRTLNPWWITGFVDAEGSFGINTTTTDSGMLKASLQFKVSQNAPNRTVLEGLIDYFGAGRVNIDKSTTNTLKFQIQDLPSIREKVSSHFEKYPLRTSKGLDYQNWLQAMEIIADKKHLTPEGKEKILDLKTIMNNSRPPQER